MPDQTSMRLRLQTVAGELQDGMTPERVYAFVVLTADKNGRRRASPMLVYADMVSSETIDRYDNDEWPIVGQCIAVLCAHGLLRIEHGPERNGYDIRPTSMIQVCNWGRVRPKRASIPGSVRRQVFERDDHRCADCGDRTNLTLDHIIPWSKGGPDTVENLQTMCRPCNSRKGAREVAA